MIEIDAQSCALTLDTEKRDRNFCYLMLIWLLLLFYSFERNHRHQEFVRTQKNLIFLQETVENK